MSDSITDYNIDKGLGSKKINEYMDHFYKEKNKPKPVVKIYSEFPMTFYGGGERLIIKIYKYFTSHSVHANIVDNYAKNSEERIVKEDLLKEIGPDLISTAFRRYGFPRFLYQEFPELEDLIIPSSDVSLIFARRIPPRRILHSLNKSNNHFVFCLHGIALEKLRLTDVRIIAHQIMIRLQLRYFSPYVKKNIYVQCLTPLIASYLTKNGSSRMNMFIIENEFRNELIELKENSDYFRVIFVGRMQNLTKGIKFLRKVIRLTNILEPGIKFVVIGNGPDLKVLDSVRDIAVILGNVDDKQKESAMQSSSLAIITSHLEPFPRVAQEFLTAGIPVVTTPASGPAYILSKNPVFGKVSSFNPRLFSRDIIAYYDAWKKDKEKYYNLRKEIARVASNMFHEESMLESYLNMILEIGSK